LFRDELAAAFDLITSQPDLAPNAAEVGASGVVPSAVELGGSSSGRLRH
jgi:hypothetical protein